MSKNKKKRNKAYSGSVTTRPTIIKVAAVDRPKLAQWFFEHKTIVKTTATIVGIAAAITFIVLGIIGALNA